MITDTHCHILPAVDDGSKNEEETKEMLRMAFAEGIEAIIATPHFECGMDRAVRQKREAAFEAARRWAEELHPGAKMYLGNELFYSESIFEALEDGSAMTINGTRYALVEFPVYADFRYLQKAVHNLVYAGYYPVIAHMERYQGLQDNMEHVEELVGMGAYMQVNTSSVLGKHGWASRRYMLKLMKHRLIHMLGTDAHDTRGRKPEMQKCVEYVRRKLGAEYCQWITEIVPNKMIRGEKISGEN